MRKGVDIGSLKNNNRSGLVAFVKGKMRWCCYILGDIQQEDVGGAGSMSPAIIAKTLLSTCKCFSVLL